MAIQKACGADNKWTPMSYQNICDAAACGPLDYTRYALQVLLKANAIQKRPSVTSRKNEWRVNPNLFAALDQLMPANHQGEKNDQKYISNELHI